jgi:hypothetical protein
MAAERRERGTRQHGPRLLEGNCLELAAGQFLWATPPRWPRQSVRDAPNLNQGPTDGFPVGTRDGTAKASAAGPPYALQQFPVSQQPVTITL